MLGVLTLPGGRVLALPNWDRPRLYVSARSARQRWEGSALYPASRPSARLYRFFLRTKALFGGAGGRVIPRTAAPLRPFVEDVIPGAEWVAIIVGTPGPTQKFTVAIWDEAGSLAGFLKYGETPRAQFRIRNEFGNLSVLPMGVAPRALKLGALGGGLAVLMTPVGGRHISPRLPPPEDVLTYLETLPAKESPVAPAEHPWIKSLMTRTPREDILIARCVEVLSRRKWRIVHHHGDFAPWNLLRIGKGKLAAVDWEFASAEGFPYVDLAHYIIQVGALMYRWRAGKVLSWGVRYLSNPTIIGLSQAEATAIVQLAAWDSYHQALDDQYSPDTPLQSLRRALWTIAA